MQVVTTVGLDIAKSVFQVHGVDAQGEVVIRRQFKRPLCSRRSSRSYPRAWWASRPVRHRTIGRVNSRRSATRCRLMPPAYVKPYVKRQKNDAADAEAICEAVTRANMRFVATKTPEQQSGLVLHRTRHLFIRQQTAVINVIRAPILASSASSHLSAAMVSRTLLNVVTDASDKRVPEDSPHVSRRSRGAITQAQRADSRVRPYDHGLASIQ